MMTRRWRILPRAVLLATLAIFATLSSGTRMGSGGIAEPVAHAATPLGWEHKGFTLNVWSETELYQSGPALQQLAQAGANTVTFTINWYTPHKYSTEIYRTSATASDASLIWAIGQARSLGLKVMLKPHLDSQDGAWRANINPTNADAWFSSYRTLITYYADLARSNGVDSLCVGAELISMSTNPAYEGRWRSLIADVRTRFPGKLSYSANWGGEGFPEEFPKIPFWDALDYLGISAYFELATTNTPTVSQLVAKWSDWKTAKLIPFQQRWGKPVLFTEGGYRSVDGTARYPWDWGMQGGLDTQEQADCYEALFQSFASVPWFAGGEFWYWSADANVSGTNLDYHVQNKPAYRTITDWFSSVSAPTPPAGGGGTGGSGTGAADQVIYGDALATGWVNWSWSSATDLASSTAYSGSRAISLRITSAWGALYLHTDQGVQTTSATSLRFAVRASAAGQRFRLTLYTDGNQQLGTAQDLASIGGDPPANTWKVYTVPLSTMGAAGGRITGLTLQDITGAAQPAILVDEIGLTGGGSTGGGSTAVYGDDLAPGWVNWSWSSSVNFAHPVPYSGARGIWWRIDAAWGALYLRTGQPVQTSAGSSLRFALRASGTGQRLQVRVYSDGDQAVGNALPLSSVGGVPPAGTWKLYDIPLSALGAAGMRISGISIQDIGGTAQPAIELDQITLTGTS